MPALSKWVVKLEAQTAQYRRELGRAERRLKKFERGQKRIADGIVSGFARIAGPAALGALTVKLAQTADEFNRLSVRIRTATRATGDFARVQQQLIATSIQTGSALEANVDLFQGFSRIRDDIGATNDQVLVLARTMGQLGVIGGTSAADMSRGMRQFIQAASQGIFRMEEFNSLVDNTPEIIARIATGLGISQGELTEMARTGKLFVDDVINALLKQVPEIAAQFQTIPNSLDRAFSALKTSIGAAASRLDQMLGVTESLADALQNVADRLAVASGSADPILLLEVRLKDLLGLQASIIRQMEKTPRGSAAFQTMSDNVASLGVQIKAATAGLVALKNAAEEVTDVKGGKKPLLAPKGPGNVTGILEGIDTEDPFGEFGIFDLGQTKKGFKEIETAAEQFAKRMAAISNRAAENMQDAFADFLFDPFEDGLKGMLRSFINTVRRMAAEAAAARIFNVIGASGGSGFLSGLLNFDGGGTVPGPMGAPRLAVVHGGEDIIPPGAGRGVTINQNNVFQGGADPATLGAWGAALKAETKAELTDELRRGRIL